MLARNTKFFTQLVIAATLSSGLLACVSNTANYTEALSDSSYGYSEHFLDEGRYQVSFVGRVDTPLETVQDYALTRAAELTLEQNLDWFELVDNKIVTQQVSGSKEVESTVVQVPNNYRCGLLGCTPARYSPTVSPAIRELPSTREKYTAILEVVMHAGNLPEKGNAYDANTIIEARELSLN